MAYSTPQKVLLLPCSPQTVEDRSQYEKLHNVRYNTVFPNNDEIYVVYKKETWKFESWGGGSDQVRLSPLHGSVSDLNSTGYKNPVIASCTFFKKIPLGMLNSFIFNKYKTNF